MSECPHHWHPDPVRLTADPPQRIEFCCHCPKVRIVSDGPDNPRPGDGLHSIFGVGCGARVPGREAEPREQPVEMDRRAPALARILARAGREVA